MKKVYVIYKKGFYGQGIFGVFTNNIEAKKNANKAAQQDKDNYHTWQVFKIPTNKLHGMSQDDLSPSTYLDNGFATPIFNECLIYEVRKGDSK